MSHTPGPWTVEVRGTKSNTWWDVNTATMHGEISVNTGEEDARLIAAAPDLLAALRVAWTRNSNHELMTFDECNAVRAAIAKAEGGADDQ